MTQAASTETSTVIVPVSTPPLNAAQSTEKGFNMVMNCLIDKFERTVREHLKKFPEVEARKMLIRVYAAIPNIIAGGKTERPTCSPIKPPPIQVMSIESQVAKRELDELKLYLERGKAGAGAELEFTSTRYLRTERYKWLNLFEKLEAYQDKMHAGDALALESGMDDLRGLLTGVNPPPKKV